jgi:CheY-like chemotaxis protein
MRPPKRKPVDPPALKSQAAEGAATLPRAKPGVLVADDEHPVRILVQLALEASGCYVWLAANGREAIDVYRKHRGKIAVVLLDVRMPGLDGPQTLQSLRKLNPGVRACFMSGDPDAYTSLQRQGAHVIAKPFQLDRLAELIWFLVQEAPADVVSPRTRCQE